MPATYDLILLKSTKDMNNRGDGSSSHSIFQAVVDDLSLLGAACANLAKWKDLREHPWNRMAVLGLSSSIRIPELGGVMCLRGSVVFFLSVCECMSLLCWVPGFDASWSTSAFHSGNK